MRHHRELLDQANGTQHTCKHKAWEYDLSTLPSPSKPTQQLRVVHCLGQTVVWAWQPAVSTFRQDPIVPVVPPRWA